jgi:hypothetical protein
MERKNYGALRRAFGFVRMLQEGLRAPQRPFIETDQAFLSDTLMAIGRGRIALEKKTAQETI